MTYTIIYHSAVKKDLKTIPQKEQKRIKNSIENKIAIDPIHFGIPLKGSMKPCFKFRVGSYRIIYDVDDQNVIILLIAHRKEAYQKAEKRK